MMEDATLDWLEDIERNRLTVKQVRSLLCRDTPYKLIGARTGKTLADSTRNKEEFIKQYDDSPAVCNGTIFARVEVTDHGCYCGSYAKAVICIWVSGK